MVARQFQVTAGRIERNGKLGARFVFVASNPGWTETFFDGFLLQQGMKRSAAMRVVTDGDDGLRNFVQYAKRKVNSGSSGNPSSTGSMWRCASPSCRNRSRA
jgi:hypothetical protein